MGAGSSMKASKRQELIWHMLKARRYDTAAHLAEEFHVSIRTIHSDMKEIMLEHPVDAIRGRYGGGYRVMPWFQERGGVIGQHHIDALKHAVILAVPEDRPYIMEVIHYLSF